MIKQYSFSEEDLGKCQDFADSFNGEFYKSRKQEDLEKIKHDNVIGKLGEIATFYLVKDKWKGVSPPDFEIYNAKQKSWAADLIDGDVKIHVKSQDVNQGEKFGVSWIFQTSDKEIFEEDADNQFIAFVSVDLDERECLLRGVVPLQFLRNKKLFSKLKSKKLQDNKRAVYLRELERYRKELWSGLNE